MVLESGTCTTCSILRLRADGPPPNTRIRVYADCQSATSVRRLGPRRLPPAFEDYRLVVRLCPIQLLSVSPDGSKCEDVTQETSWALSKGELAW